MRIEPVYLKKINLAAAKKCYQVPVLLVYGSVAMLTQGGASGSNEASSTTPATPGCGSGTSTGKKTCSARHMKENISRVGAHPLGFGLYLFDYRPEFKDYAGHGRQFGVMIDEVVSIVPAAVGTDGNGYPVVDYAMLGVHRPVMH